MKTHQKLQKIPPEVAEPKYFPPCFEIACNKGGEYFEGGNISRNPVDVQLVNSREHQLGLEGLVLAALFHSVSSCFNNGVALLCSNPLLIV